MPLETNAPHAWCALNRTLNVAARGGRDDKATAVLYADGDATYVCMVRSTDNQTRALIEVATIETLEIWLMQGCQEKAGRERP